MLALQKEYEHEDSYDSEMDGGLATGARPHSKCAGFLRRREGLSEGWSRCEGRLSQRWHQRESRVPEADTRAQSVRHQAYRAEQAGRGRPACGIFWMLSAGSPRMAQKPTKLKLATAKTPRLEKILSEPGDLAVQLFRPSHSAVISVPLLRLPCPKLVEGR